MSRSRWPSSMQGAKPAGAGEKRNRSEPAGRPGLFPAPTPRRGILSVRAGGILAFALGVAALLFSVFMSIPLVLTDHGSIALLSVLFGYLAFAYGVYYRFVGFRKRFLQAHPGETLTKVGSLDRPDIIISPTFFLIGDRLIEDDFGPWAAGAAMVAVAVVLMVFYWFLLTVVG